jgi:hypothetical protein
MLFEVKKSFHRTHEGRLFPGKIMLFVKCMKMSRDLVVLDYILKDSMLWRFWGRIWHVRNKKIPLQQQLNQKVIDNPESYCNITGIFI